MSAVSQAFDFEETYKQWTSSLNHYLSSLGSKSTASQVQCSLQKAESALAEFASNVLAAFAFGGYDEPPELTEYRYDGQLHTAELTDALKTAQSCFPNLNSAAVNETLPSRGEDSSIDPLPALLELYSRVIQAKEYWKANAKGQVGGGK